MHESTTREGISSTRQQNAPGEGDRLRTELLDAATDLIAEHGTIEGISLRAIARRAGVSPAAVYRHFDDHSELLHEAIGRCWEALLQELKTARGGDGDAFDAFDRLGIAYARFAVESPGRYRVMFSDNIEFAAETSSVANATFMLLVELVQKMLQVLGDGRSTHIVAVQVHTWVHGIVAMSNSHPDFEWPPVEQQLLGLRDALGLVRPAD